MKFKKGDKAINGPDGEVVEVIRKDSYGYEVSVMSCGKKCVFSVPEAQLTKPVSYAELDDLVHRMSQQGGMNGFHPRHDLESLIWSKAVLALDHLAKLLAQNESLQFDAEGGLKK